MAASTWPEFPGGPGVSQQAGKTSRTTATLAGLAAIAMWSCLAVLSVASGTVPPFQLAAMTFFVGGLAGALSWPLRPGAMASLRQNWRVWLLGVGGLFGYHLAYFTAIRAAPALQVSLVAYLWPLFIVVFSALLPGEKLKRHHLAGVALGAIGAFLVISRGAPVKVAPAHVTGLAIAFLCALIWAGYSVASRRFKNVSSDVVAGFCLVSSALSLVCHVAFESTVWPQGARQWLAIGGLGLFPVGLAFYVWDHGVKHGDIQVLGAASYAAPALSAVILVAAGYGELHWSLPVAVAAITAGGLIAAKDMLWR